MYCDYCKHNDELIKLLKCEISSLQEQIDNLKKSRDAGSKTNKDIFERIEKLEKQTASGFDLSLVKKNISDIEIDIADIDHDALIVSTDVLHMQNQIELIFTKLNNKSEFKKPHKCPVCDGECINKNRLVMDGLKDTSTINMKNPECQACEGKGIVWG